MGVFLRKSLGSGPLRFNISKSGLGFSTGVKGLRVGVGPRGVGVSGGRKGIYFRKSLSSRGRGTSLSSSPASSDFVGTIARDSTITPEQNRDAVQFTEGEKPMKPGGYPLAITLGLLGLLSALSALASGAIGSLVATT